MAYRALYRQYRPSTFAAVVGQEHITTTLKNQVSTGHISHAYLFCGTRGTGKTTTARILARAVNCLAPENGEPCGKCEACLASAINSGDIVEIDAASNNGVDDVRALIESAQYAPIQLKRRVFIIDEVHMLSSQAFNALLKTLEEPPAHILFILATTEPQKLPATIVSRCQRYDFHRHTVDNIIKYMKAVLHGEGVSIEDDGLMLIARSADGGMRDALSLCDQCLAFCGDHVSARDVYDVLGSMDEGFLFRITDQLLDSDANGALRSLADLFRSGRDLGVFASDLTAHFRALLIAKACGDCADLLECTGDTMQRYRAQAGSVSAERLLSALSVLTDVLAEMRYHATPRTLVESALVRICRPEDSHSILDLEARVARLEQGGLPRTAAPAQNPVQNAIPAAPAQKAAPVQSAPEQPAHDEIPLPEPPPEEGYAALTGTDAPPAPSFRAEPTVQAQPVKRAAAPAADASPAQQAARPDAAAGGNECAALWQAVLSDVQQTNMMVFMMARIGTALSVTDDTLTIGLPDQNEVQFQALSAAINYGILQGALAARRPELHLLLTKTHIEPAGDEISARAKAIFGDQLVIE